MADVRYNSWQQRRVGNLPREQVGMLPVVLPEEILRARQDSRCLLVLSFWVERSLSSGVNLLSLSCG